MQFLVILLISFWAIDSYAFRVCNSFQNQQYLAIAYPQNLSYVSNGWFVIEPKKCIDLTFNNPSEVYYIYFEDTKGLKSVGDTPFCIQRPGPFLIANSNRQAINNRCSNEKFTQRYLPGASLLWLGEPLDTTPSPPPKDQLKWIGGYQFEGGLVKQASIELNDLFLATRLELDLSACSQNTRILKLEVLSEGSYIEATQSSPNSTSFLLPRKLQIDEISISINGPLQSELIPCYIPVFAE